MRRTEPAAPQSEGVDLKQTAVALADHLVVRRDLEDKIARKLDAGGLKLEARRVAAPARRHPDRLWPAGTSAVRQQPIF